MKKQSLAKNFTYQFLYQIIILIIPLVLSPYLTRTLQSKAIGIYTYVNSIAYYFVILSMLGITRHGQRVIAERRDDEYKLRKTFWSLFVVHLIWSILALASYIGFILIFVSYNKTIFFIESLFVLSACVDITWLFYGIENFKPVVIKNAIIKIVECILIFILVKSPSDISIYTFIVTASTLTGQLVLFPQAIHIAKPIKITKTDLYEHIKPLFVLSVSVIAVSLYTVFDKTLLGFLSTADNVAYYEYADKLIKVPKTVISVIGTVMFPRACVLAERGDKNGQYKYMRYSLIFASMIGMLALFGFASLGKEFSQIYYGESFSVSGNVMIAMSPLVYIVGIGDILRSQYIIPNHMDKEFSICIVINAIINIILSVLFIPVFGIYGAVLGTAGAELFGMLYQLFLCRKYVDFKTIVETAVPFFVFGIIMYIAIKIVGENVSASFMHFIFKLFIGVGIYIGLTLLYVMHAVKLQFPTHLSTDSDKN